jgi:hypothetical protein
LQSMAASAWQGAMHEHQFVSIVNDSDAYDNTTPEKSAHKEKTSIEEMLLAISKVDGVQQEHYINSLDREEQDALLAALAGMDLGALVEQNAGGERGAVLMSMGATGAGQSSRTPQSGAASMAILPRSTTSDVKQEEWANEQDRLRTRLTERHTCASQRSDATKEPTDEVEAKNPNPQAQVSPVHKPLQLSSSGGKVRTRSGYYIRTEIIEARHLPSAESEGASQPQKPDAFACLSLVAQPYRMRHKHFFQIGHATRRQTSAAASLQWKQEKDDEESLHVFPQIRTHVEQANSNPRWNSVLHLTKTFPSIVEIDSAFSQHRRNAREQPEIDLDGSAVLMLLTLHDAANENSLLGRILVPFVTLNTRVDQW